MSGDNEDDESVWDEIGAFTSADPSEVEPTDDDSETRVDEPDVIDIEPVETDEQADPDHSIEEREDDYSPDPTDSPGTADLFGDAGTTESDAETNSTSGADQPAEAADAPDAEEIFDQMDVSAVDGEALWDELAGFASGADELDTAAEPTVDEDHTETAAGGSPESRASAEASADSDEAVVDKRQYCQQCPFFSEPPAVACSHDGTSIVEVLTDGQFRLRGCPVVTESGPDRTILNDGS